MVLNRNAAGRGRKPAAKGRGLAPVAGIACLALALLAAGCDNPLAQAAREVREVQTSPVLSVSTEAGVELSPGASVDLGDLTVAAYVEARLVLSNSGRRDLELDVGSSALAAASGTETGAFSIVSAPERVAAGAEASLVIRYSRGTSGAKAATLTIKSNDASRPEFALSLSAYDVDPTSCALSSFGFSDPAARGIVGDGEVTVFVPWDAAQLAMLVADFQVRGGKVTVGGVEQASGRDTNNFTVPVVYRVTSLDGAHHADYTVTVIRNPSAPTVVPHEGAIEVSWGAVAGASGYEVWYFAGPAASSAVKSGGTVLGTSATIGGLVDGVTYYVWTKAKYPNGTTSGLGAASASALVERKYFGWLFSGDTSGMSRYPLSTADGSVGAGQTVFDHPLGGGVVEMEIDEAKGFVFFGYKRDNNSNPPYMVRSAKIDPSTGELTFNGEEETDWRSLNALQLSPDGKYLYALNSYIDYTYVFCWDVDQDTGALSNKRSTSVSGTVGPSQDLEANPGQNLLYLLRSGSVPDASIKSYAIDPATGALTFKATSPTLEYPLGLAYDSAADRLVVSYQEDIGLASYKLGADGVPTAEDTRTNGLGGEDFWRTVLTAPAAGGGSHVFALNSWSVSYLFGLADDETFAYSIHKMNCGTAAWDGDFATAPSGTTYLYTANYQSANISSYRLKAEAGQLSAIKLDNAAVAAPKAIRGLYTYW